MAEETGATADPTAVRVALWRALHVLADPPPYVLDDEIGLRLADPDENWRARPDVDPQETLVMRASIMARARFVEDLVAERAARVGQFVLLGAGLDSFAQRRPDVAAGLKIYEVDQPGPQDWKRRRLVELEYGIPEWLRLVPVDFETQSWWERLLAAAGFAADRPAVVASTGVTMYLTRDAVVAMLRQAAALAPGSTLVTTFMPTLERVESADRALRRERERRAASSGTPFITFFAPEDLVALARDAGFSQARHVPAAEPAARYFAGRTDGLRPSGGEELLVATV
ncbi:class I SAM-dependent methyltransferase [Streptomyces sp. NPDC002514]|uniref:class I SAM-dependent methyltransferase n=1 Tax=Streptomyces sp. NPDC001270 TaxID=3364554 RepID=UPI00368446BC